MQMIKFKFSLLKDDVLVRHPCSAEEYRGLYDRLPNRLFLAAMRVPPYEALNCGQPKEKTESITLAQQLKLAINNLEVVGFDANDGQVDYAYLRASQEYADYVELTRHLQYFDLNILETTPYKLSFWINIYNALVIHATIAYEVKKSILEIRGLFDRVAYNIGGFRFSGDDIEHGILRANRGHVVIPGPRFTQNDPRRVFSLESLDHRIHFALSCASHSCPPIAVYDAPKIEQQLQVAGINFVNNGGVVVDQQQDTVSLSRIFSWYRVDFGGGWLQPRMKILETLLPYLQDESDRNYILENKGKLKIMFQPYDWSLNA